MIKTEILNWFHMLNPVKLHKNPKWFVVSACLPQMIFGYSRMFSLDTTEALLLGDSTSKKSNSAVKYLCLSRIVNMKPSTI